MERDSLIDDMIMEQGRLTAAVHQAAGGDVPGWLAAREDFRSAWQRALADARQANVADFSLYSVTCRKLLDLGRIA
jgi:NAD-specific glutamate dehydrogenase